MTDNISRELWDIHTYPCTMLRARRRGIYVVWLTPVDGYVDKRMMAGSSADAIYTIIYIYRTSVFFVPTRAWRLDLHVAETLGHCGEFFGARVLNVQARG